MRRLLLTLRVMAWLEDALCHTWESVRPQDLVTFAFSAIKPEWPRRELAISHRSADAKPILIEMKLWSAYWCAIDANYVPSWETNTGMVWGLFAAAPAIVRINSPRYRESLWCRREYEVCQFLAQHNDFLPGRRILDVEDAAVRTLDQYAAVRSDDNIVDRREAPPSVFFGSFPPMATVWSPKPMPEWEVVMLRAAVREIRR